MSSFRTLFSVALAGALLMPSGSILGQSNTFEWAENMSSGQTLEVKGIIGEIRATLASDNRAQVIARKRGTSGDFDEVAVEVARDGDRIIICTVYGSWKHGRDQCHPDHPEVQDRDRYRNQSIDVEVDYEVRVPAGVDFEAAMVSGDIDADGLRSDVSVNTVEGWIHVVTTGRAWANSVSGDMEIQMDDFSGGDLDFSTVSGDITLWLPSDFSADVEFSSLSGDFDSDFDINIRRQRSRWVGSSIEGTIGREGGRDMSLKTVSGDVELRRRR